MERWRECKSEEGNDGGGRTGSGGGHSGTEAEWVRRDHSARRTLGFEISERKPNSKARWDLNIASNGARGFYAKQPFNRVRTRRPEFSCKRHRVLISPILIPGEGHGGFGSIFSHAGLPKSVFCRFRV
jgi:hypothetical protein